MTGMSARIPTPLHETALWSLPDCARPLFSMPAPSSSTKTGHSLDDYDDKTSSRMVELPHLVRLALQQVLPQQVGENT